MERNIPMREEQWWSFLFVVKEKQCHVIQRYFWCFGFGPLCSNVLFPFLSLVCINGFLILALQHLVPSFHDKKCLPSYLFSTSWASHTHEFQQQLHFLDSDDTVIFKHDEQTWHLHMTRRRQTWKWNLYIQLMLYYAVLYHAICS